MKVDGKAIADSIFYNLQKQVAALKEKNVTPHLAIILVGDDPASQAYVKRKVIKTEDIGGKATVFHFKKHIAPKKILQLVQTLNSDQIVHGIIIQRPLPESFDLPIVNHAIIPEKDIDAFHTNTLFEMPLAKATLLILEHIFHTEKKRKQKFTDWLQKKNIVVVGKGETGGGPIISLLQKIGIKPAIIDSKTENPKELTKHADVIISATGKSHVLDSEMVKKGVILISVGLHKEDDGKLHGDYEEEDIKGIASFYTPTPGGVGPVNVACLLQNLIQAAEKLSY